MKQSILFFILLVIFNYTTAAQTTYTWNGGSGNWSEPTNWTPAGVPGAVDSAIIVTTGTITLTTDITISGLSYTSANLTGDYNFLVTSTMNWNGGVIMGPGVITIDAGATLQLSGGNQQTLSRDLVNNGTTIWDA